MALHGALGGELMLDRVVCVLLAGCVCCIALLSAPVQAVSQSGADVTMAHSMAVMAVTQQQPRQIAVILPQSGRFAAAAEAIRAGLEQAQRLQAPSRRAQLRFYDAGEDPSSHWQQYERAVANGAEFVIGPLPRAAVNYFASQASLPVPVLALNRGQDIRRIPAGFYQFGLSPEEEAMQVARRAIRAGHRRAVLVAADTDLGQRLARSFQIYFENMGGMVHTHLIYDPPERTQLSSRHESTWLALRSGSGWSGSMGEPDMLFLAVEPGHLAVLRTELERRYPGGLPLFSTSSLYHGHPHSLNDPSLFGIQYVDMPVLMQLSTDERFSNIPGHAIRESILNSPHPWPRLIALGFDAYTLIPHLPRLEQSWRQYHLGTTGELRLDFERRVVRNLPLAVIEQGRAVMRGPISEDGLFLFF